LAFFLHNRLPTFFFTLFISMSLPYPVSPLAFLRRASRIRRPAHGAMRSLPEYLDERAALLTPEHRRQLLGAFPLLRIQFAGLIAPGFPHSLLVRAVLRRHRKVFREYCRFRQIRWSTVTLAR
jgi:hypothetical protein